MFIGTRYEELFPASSWRAFRNFFKWPGSSKSLWSLHKNERIHEGWGGDTLPRGRLPPPPTPPPTPLLTMFIGTRFEKLFPASSWRAFRKFKWPGSSQSLWSLHKNESIHEGWGGGDTLPRGRLSPPPRLLTLGGLCSFVGGRDSRNCFQHPLEGQSESSNDQALLNPFVHYIKMKAYMRVEVEGHFTPE